ncbi:Predicted transcriptional regulator [Cedecea neteri]|uniref:Predicted transcriptional regulator n=1 Tax=Cedecea neteri TaxID=158822 RepID=A0A2X2SXX2_9ENTR|nr:Predicted transcriptional regulator [Cedecea neteri]
MSNNDQQSYLTNDKMVDMAFITSFTGLTDKWFYKLIKDGEFSKAN